LSGTTATPRGRCRQRHRRFAPSETVNDTSSAGALSGKKNSSLPFPRSQSNVGAAKCKRTVVKCRTLQCRRLQPPEAGENGWWRASRRSGQFAAPNETPAGRPGSLDAAAIFASDNAANRLSRCQSTSLNFLRPCCTRFLQGPSRIRRRTPAGACQAGFVNVGRSHCVSG
jgi:hypothetical protein